jgi:hypothetical protein
MTEEAGGEGQFVGVTLHPRVTISPDSDVATAERLHQTPCDVLYRALNELFGHA